MSYCTRSDIEKRYGSNAVLALCDADRSGVLNSDEEGYITAAIEEADEDIDSALGGVYGVPFTTVPNKIKSLSAMLAFANLCHRAGRQIELANSLHNLANEDLDKLRGGQMQLKGCSRTDAGGVSDSSAATFSRTKRDSSGNIVNREERREMDNW